VVWVVGVEILDNICSIESREGALGEDAVPEGDKLSKDDGTVPPEKLESK
jgi:hypothetical protein